MGYTFCTQTNLPVCAAQDSLNTLGNFGGKDFPDNPRLSTVSLKHFNKYLNHITNKSLSCYIYSFVTSCYKTKQNIYNNLNRPCLALSLACVAGDKFTLIYYVSICMKLKAGSDFSMNRPTGPIQS